jgi:hypothetical protein
MPQQVIVGQEVGVQNSSGNFISFGYKVTKVTPTGRVTIMRKGGIERKFDKDGYEMPSYKGQSRYRCDTLVTDVEKARENIATNERCKTASNAIKNVRVEQSYATYGKDGLHGQIVQLQALLDEAKLLVEAI